MTLYIRLALISLLIILAGSACTQSSKTAVEHGNEAGILHIGNGDEPSDVDPHTTTGVPEYHIQLALFEALVSKHPKTLEIVPGVADRWTISDDGITYTFHIRDSARWSNGDELVADDFVWAWQRALSPSLGNQYAYSLFVIKNAERFNSGEIKDFTEVGAKALDKDTLQITLENATPYFLKLLDHHSMYPVHRATIEKFGAIDARGTAWTRTENFVGNGPFTIKEWSPNKVFSVKKNPLYWDADKVSLNEIHFYPVQLSTTEERMFRAGQLHITNEVPTEKYALYQQNNPQLLSSHPYFGTYFYRLNTTLPALADVRVRMALAMSIDRETITQKVTKSGEVPAYNLTPPGTLGYTATAKVSYDPVRAKQLLAEAGYPNGEGFPSLEIMYNTFESHKKIALTIQQMWKNTLNIDVTLLNLDWKVFLNNQRTLNYQISRASWIGDYLDPNTFLDMFLTGGGNNETGWGNARYDELIALAAQAKTTEERYQYFQEADRILTEEVPIIPIYTYARNYLIHQSVKGLEPNIMDYRSYKNMSLSASEQPQ